MAIFNSYVSLPEGNKSLWNCGGDLWSGGCLNPHEIFVPLELGRTSKEWPAPKPAVPKPLLVKVLAVPSMVLLKASGADWLVIKRDRQEPQKIKWFGSKIGFTTRTTRDMGKPNWSQCHRQANCCWQRCGSSRCTRGSQPRCVGSPHWRRSPHPAPSLRCRLGSIAGTPARWRHQC